MEIGQKKINERLVLINITGRFNIEEVFNFEKVINDVILLDPEAICIDLSGLKYIDSSGIGSLIKAMNITKNKNIDLILSDLNTEIMNIFKLAYLDRFFNLSTRADTLKKFA
jgi:anti-anti-sigma factor